MLRYVVTAIFTLLSFNASALDIQQWKTKNGANVLFVASTGLPMIDVRMTFKAGSSRDGGVYGLSRLTNALIVEGTGKLSSEDVAESMESVGAQLGHDSLQDMAWTSLRLLSDLKNRDDIIDLFARVTALPSFPSDSIERDRTSMLTSLKERKNNIEEVTTDTFKEALYSGHVYQVGAHGKQDTLSSIKQSDLIDFHKRYYVANNSAISIVGDLTTDQAKQLSEQLTKYLKPGKKADRLDKPKLTKAKTIFVDFDTTQTHIVQGLPVLTRSDDDYYALYVGNHILGGSGFGSRLMREIREKKGLSYSVYSYFSPMESEGPFQMAMQTANRQVSQARKLLDKILIDFIENGPTEKELDNAKKNITGGFPLKIDSNSKISTYLALIGFYELPLDYLDSFNSKIEQVSVAQIKDAFQRRVKLDQIIEVVVGPKK